MATQAQIAANRANARKSTGPRTAKGKAKVRRNATRHGATAAADPASIATWLKVILDKPDMTADIMLSDDEAHQFAVDLAEAEARLLAARRALAAFEADPDPLNHFPDVADLVDEIGLHTAFEEGAVDDDAIEACIARAREDFYSRHNKLLLIRRKFRLLHRYLREAQAIRDRCFRAWIARMCQASKNVDYRNKANFYL